MASGHQGAGSLVHGGASWLVVGSVLEGNPASSPSPQWPVTFLKAVEGSVSEDLNQLSNNFIFFFASKVLKAPDCYQLEHFEDQTVYLFFLVTNQIRELRAVAVIG